MTAIYQRKNRKTRGTIELHHVIANKVLGAAFWMDLYWCECEHGTQTRRTSRKSSALRDMAHPDEWCVECKAIVDIITEYVM